MRRGSLPRPKHCNGCESRPVIDLYPWLKVLHVFLAIMAVTVAVIVILMAVNSTT